jgi:hypothetical protein
MRGGSVDKDRLKMREGSGLTSLPFLWNSQKDKKGNEVRPDPSATESAGSSVLELVVMMVS